MSDEIIPQEILLTSRLVLNSLGVTTNILNSDAAKAQNEVIANQLRILEQIYRIPTISTGIGSAISETYFQYFRKARELYVISLNLGLKDSEVDEETLHYKIVDDSLGLEVFGMFNDILTKEFLQPEILNTVFGLGFFKITIINPISGYSKVLTEDEWNNTYNKSRE